MTVSTLMTGITPSSTWAGEVTNDLMVLAVDCGSTPAASITPTTVAGFAVVQDHIESVESNLNAESQDKTYLRTGKSTSKTSNQRSFSISGDHYVGDTFQDFALSHAVKFGVGSAVQRRYVYFNMQSGLGESGLCSIIVNSDGSGSAGELSTIDIELKSAGEAPESYTYSAPVAGGEVSP